RAMAGHVPVRVEPLGRHGVEPPGQVELLPPLLERAAGPPHPLDHRTDPAVAPAHDALREGRPRIVPAQLGAALAEVVAEQPDLAGELLDRVLAEPLERGVRLGNEPADGRGAAGALRVAAPDP